MPYQQNQASWSAFKAAEEALARQPTQLVEHARRKRGQERTLFRGLAIGLLICAPFWALLAWLVL
ncbi:MULTISPECIES: hypothetical protein [Acetobacter]|uniref:Uncharacterized protein n=1 Tax=Acetobacter sacchari TaxID=2661687 RepID=A0ABS3M0R7_9PROT|nr:MULTISPECIES: hypothetical protein [Acetobacter]MBO1361729.1 hypothetical protein [Acetobacter sacchari]